MRTTTTRTRRTTAAAARRSTSAAGALLLALSLGACSQSDGVVDTDDAVEQTDQDSTEPDAGLDIETKSFDEVQGELAALVGEEVAMTAQVEDIVTDQAFTVTSLEASGAPPIVVVDAYPEAVVEAGTPVRFSGLVLDDFDPETVTRTLGVQLDDEVAIEMQGDPYIVATHLDTDIDDDRDAGTANN